MTDRRTERSWTVDVHPFDIAESVVTRELWNEVHANADQDEPAGFPVVEVTWREAIMFCNRLSQQHALVPVYEVEVVESPAATGWTPHDRPAPDDWRVTWRHGANGYRLPTEAEWQIACQAGTRGPNYAKLHEIAWFADNSDERLHPVKGKMPNAWGVFDMLGGVWEWNWDVYDLDVYGAYRVIRGGGWADEAWSCRAGVRRRTHPSARFDDLGFRLARSVTQ